MGSLLPEGSSLPVQWSPTAGRGDWLRALSGQQAGGGRRTVEVVGWLVEDEDVRLRVRDGGESDAGALAARESGGGKGLHLRRDAARVQVRAQLLLVPVAPVARELVQQELQRREGQVDLVRVVLVNERDANTARAHNFALGGLELAQHELDERRLAVAVLAEQHDARLRVDANLRAAEEHLVLWHRRVAEGDVLDLHGETGHLTRRLQGERQLGILDEGGGVRLHLGRLLLELLRLRGRADADT